MIDPFSISGFNLQNWTRTKSLRNVIPASGWNLIAGSIVPRLNQNIYKVDQEKFLAGSIVPRLNQNIYKVDQEKSKLGLA